MFIYWIVKHEKVKIIQGYVFGLLHTKMQMLQQTKSLCCKQMAQLFYQQASVLALHGLEHLQPENYNIES